MEEAIYDKIFEKLPFTEAEIKYDYVTYSLPKTKVVFVVAMRRLIIAQYYAVLKSFCNLNPISLEPESLSLLRNIPFQFDFYKGHFLIHIKEHAVQWFTFFGGLIFDSKSISLQGKTHKKLGQVDEKGIVENLANDIKKSIKFFHDKTDQDIGEVIIAGYQKQLPSLAKDLQSKISCPVSTVKNYRMDISNLETDDPQSFYLAAGAALKGLGLNTNMPINLLRKGTTIDKVLV
jgi:Tfp pilus assembly PilM family ATPase